MFLIAKSGKTEKLPFTNYLRERFAEAEVQPIDLVFDSMLSSEDLLSLDRTENIYSYPHQVRMPNSINSLVHL